MKSLQAKLGAWALSSLLFLGLFPVTVATSGCSQSDAINLANAFIASAKAIVAADPSAPYVANLEEAITAMETAEAGWNGSSVNCALGSAANTAVEIIDQIAPASPVALIATVAVAGFDALQAVLFPCTSTATSPAALVAHTVSGHSLRNSASYASTKESIGRARLFPAHAYRSAFNKAAKQSGLAVRI